MYWNLYSWLWIHSFRQRETRWWSIIYVAGHLHFTVISSVPYSLEFLAISVSFLFGQFVVSVLYRPPSSLVSLISYHQFWKICALLSIHSFLVILMLMCLFQAICVIICTIQLTCMLSLLFLQALREYDHAHCYIKCTCKPLCNMSTP